jgi:hypothetical protein
MVKRISDTEVDHDFTRCDGRDRETGNKDAKVEGRQGKAGKVQKVEALVDTDNMALYPGNEGK